MAKPTEDRSFVAGLGNADLGRHEFRTLLMAHRRGRVDNAALRSVTGLDTLRASRLLRTLRDRELLTLRARGRQLPHADSCSS